MELVLYLATGGEWNLPCAVSGAVCYSVSMGQCWPRLQVIGGPWVYYESGIITVRRYGLFCSVAAGIAAKNPNPPKMDSFHWLKCRKDGFKVISSNILLLMLMDSFTTQSLYL